MAEDFRTDHTAPGDGLFHDEPAFNANATPIDELDSEESRKVLNRLLTWLYEERELQAENRMDMAIDQDMYDGFQWRPEDAAEVESRGQMALVFNELAPMIDWMIGTERRARVDYKVLPRAEDDVQMADVKTKVMKYLGDVNHAVYVRSNAFSEAIKAGLSWIEDGIRDDYTKERIYKRHESWRNVLFDSRGAKGDDMMDGCRYLFRWRDVDLDVACKMFPARSKLLEESAFDSISAYDDDEALDGWGAPMSSYMNQASGSVRNLGRGSLVSGGGVETRRRVRMYECQFREPVSGKVIDDGPFRGVLMSEFDPIAAASATSEGVGLIDKVVMRMHIALFVPAGLLAMSAAPWRHNEFSLTPLWCYRRGRDGMPYGMIRRVRDLQLDLNKRASKANFLINTNQIIADSDATDDWDTLRDEANRPDGVIVKKKGADLTLRRDSDQVAGQVEMMRLTGQSIQKSGGVADENLGRQTNAVSGEAIKARQLQGSVVTTEPFDSLRLAHQVSGAKELSLIEQFMTEAKVIRLTADKKLDWVKINQPEVDADGMVRFLDDITATMADFKVDEQDYAGTLRQVMFDALNQVAQRLPPEVALRLLTMAFEFSDLPNKDEIVAQFRKITGEPDPDKDLTPEEEQQQAEQAQAQAEALQMQREDAQLALQERQAKVREINAKAAKLEADAQGADEQGVQNLAARARMQAQDEIDRLTMQLGKLTAEFNALRARADNAVEVARIQADARIRAAEITSRSDARLQAISDRLDQPQTA